MADQGTDVNGPYVDLSFTNSGTANATNVSITSITFRVLTGSGTIAVNAANSPALPDQLGTTLLAGSGNAVVARFYLNVTGTIVRCSISEVGSYTGFEREDLHDFADAYQPVGVEGAREISHDELHVHED